MVRSSPRPSPREETAGQEDDPRWWQVQDSNLRRHQLRRCLGSHPSTINDAATPAASTSSVFPTTADAVATARHGNTGCAMLSLVEGRKQRTCRSAAGGSEKHREAPLLCQVVHALLEHVFHLAVDLFDVLLVVDAFGVVVELDRLQESGANLGRQGEVGGE
jgi:hypothetical protein